MSSREGFKYLDSLPPWDGKNFAPLEIPRAMLDALGNPQASTPAIHIAGTNGKGSVATFLGSMFLASGARVGQFSSPHLARVEERCQINGAPVDSETFNAALLEVKHVATALNVQPTYFVASTVASFLVFSRAKLDLMLIEVGLGGRFDATNVLRNCLATVITSIGFDHVPTLGTTLEEIAWNKAGILKPGVPVFLGQMAEASEAVIRKEALQLGSPVFSWEKEISFDETSGRIDFLGLSVDLPQTEMSLAGSYQRANAALAAVIAIKLKLSENSIKEGIRRARWPGRLERCVYKEQLSVLLDAAHNEDGVRALANYVMQREVAQQFASCTLVFGVLCRKDWSGIISEVLRFQAEARRMGLCVDIVFVPIEGVEAVSPDELVRSAGCGRAFQSLQAALNDLIVLNLGESSKKLTFIFGSLFLIAEARGLLGLAEDFSSYQKQTEEA